MLGFLMKTAGQRKETNAENKIVRFTKMNRTAL